MSDPDDRQFESVDRLVAEYLDAETQRVDATSLVARLRSQAADAAAVSASTVVEPDKKRGPGAKSGGWRWVLWPAITAAAVVVAFLGGRHIGPASVNASTVLQGVRTTHSDNLDRCYRVQFAPDPRYWNRKNKLDGPSESTLWTRGDRFWADCTIGDLKLAIGSNEHGTIWVTSDPSKGIRFTDSRSQLPEKVALLCAINSMTVPALVDDVLADFDLRAENGAAQSGRGTTLIWAKLKPGRTHPLLSAAMLEIDAESRVLQRLVLWTVQNGDPKGTVTYTLLKSETIDDAQYRLESHLDADTVVEPQSFDRNKRPTKSKPEHRTPDNRTNEKKSP